MIILIPPFLMKCLPSSSLIIMVLEASPKNDMTISVIFPTVFQHVAQHPAHSRHSYIGSD